jgi:hypothetical protein
MSVRVLIASMLCWSSFAFADKVPPPPKDCPAGSTGVTGHEGEHCVPLDCKVDADCKGGLTCQEFPLCIEEQRLMEGKSQIPSAYLFVRGTCEQPSTCKAPASCKSGKRCIKAATVATPVTASSAPQRDSKIPESPKAETEKTGGCSVSSPENSGALLLVLCLLSLLVKQRRR